MDSKARPFVNYSVLKWRWEAMEFGNGQSNYRHRLCHCETLYQKFRGRYESGKSRDIEGSHDGENPKFYKKQEVA
jgi:hypothetical protein